jgi:hypothetical protein
MTKLLHKLNRGCFQLLCESILGIGLLLLPSLWAGAGAHGIQLVLGDSATARNSGVVVVTMDGHTLGEEAFPAISADRGEIAILYGSHEYVTGLGVDIIDVAAQISTRRFNLNWSAEGTTSDLQVEEVQERIEDANAYLETRGFRTRTEFYDFNFIFSADYRRQFLGEKLPEFWEREIGPWKVVYWKAKETLEIFEEDSTEALFTLKPPLMVYGIGPGTLCSTRSVPTQGWYDDKAEVIVLRLLFAPGANHACDRPDRWLVARLGHS